MLTDLVKDGGTVDGRFSCCQDLAPFGISGEFDPLAAPLFNYRHFQSMINSRGHPVDFNREAHHVNATGFVNTFFETLANALFSYSARYAGKRPATGAEVARLKALADLLTRNDAPAVPDGDKLVAAIIDQFAARHFKLELDRSAFSENNLTRIQNDIAKSAIEKGYALRREGADLNRHQRDVVRRTMSRPRALAASTVSKPHRVSALGPLP